MLLFVYGTMMRAGRNHPRLWETGAVHIPGDFRTEDPFQMYLGYRNIAPLAVRDEHGFSVAGELYAVPGEKVIFDIDPCEGHPNLYRREIVKLYGIDHLDIEVHMYVYVGEIIEKDRRILPVQGALRYLS